MEHYAFLVYFTSYILENVPTVWQACHQVGDILGSAAAAQRGKNMYFYYRSFKKSVKLKKEGSGVWSQGWRQEKTLTPCYRDSYSLGSLLSCLQRQTCRDKRVFQLHDGFCLPGKAQVPVEERCWSLHKIKNYFIFQDSVNKKAFQFFSKKPFPFEETLESELGTRVTTFITWPHRLHASSTGSTAGFYRSPQWLCPPARILT